MKPITGAQLWSLRNLLREQPEAILQQLAAAGYTIVEPAGFDASEMKIQGFDPQQLKALVQDQGLTMVSGHFQVNLEDAFTACETAASIGMKYVVRSFFDHELEQNVEAYRRAADVLNQMGKTAHEFGLQLAYHNHAHELEQVDGIFLFDILLKYTNPEWVVFQPDLGWMGWAGQNVTEMFNQSPNRFPLWHLRDIDAVTQKSTTIGSGNIDFKPALAAQKIAGLQYLIVEMASGVEDPLGKILNSHAVVESWQND